MIRRWLLVVCLLVAQGLAAAHALEHLSGDAGLPAAGDACVVCLAGHCFDNPAPRIGIAVPPSPARCTPGNDASCIAAPDVAPDLPLARGPPRA